MAAAQEAPPLRSRGPQPRRLSPQACKLSQFESSVLLLAATGILLDTGC